jgi:hypothetical protein
MFNQVTKTSVIREHTIHYDTLFDFCNINPFGGFLIRGFS